MRSKHDIVMVAAVAVAEKVCSDRMKHGNLWTSIVRRVGAVDGLLDPLAVARHPRVPGGGAGRAKCSIEVRLASAMCAVWLHNVQDVARGLAPCASCY